MSVLHCNLARPDFRKYNFGEAAPAVQEPIVSLPVLFQAFHAQGEANQQLIELDQGRVGTSLRQIDGASTHRGLRCRRRVCPRVWLGRADGCRVATSQASPIADAAAAAAAREAT